MTKFKHVKRVKDRRGGPSRYYFRLADGALMPLRGEFGSPEFRKHHAELLTQRDGPGPVAIPMPVPTVVEFKPKPKSSPGHQVDEMLAGPRERPVRVAFMPGSIGWTIERYLASREYGSKSEGTRKNYRSLLDDLKAALGRGMMADLKTKHVTLFCREIQERRGPSRGKAMLAVISNVWHYALGLREANMPDEPYNPTTYAKVEYAAKKGRAAWPLHLQKRFVDGAPSHLQLLFALALYTGQRRSDLQIVKWSDYDERAGIINVRQQKTDEQVPVPVHKRLAKVLAATPRIADTILTTSPLSTRAPGPYVGEASLSHAVLERLRAIGVPDGQYTLHGLRTTCGVVLAESGANEVEIMRILGHRKPEMAHYYIREASKKKVGRTGMRKWETADDDAEVA